MEPAGIAEKQRWVLEAVDRHELPLLRFAVRLLGAEDAARDAVQHAFLKLCGQSPERLRGREGPWLMTVCRNHIVDTWRQVGNLPTIGTWRQIVNQPGLRRPRAGPRRGGRAADLACSINRLVDQLPLPQREAIALWSEGFSYHEVACVTGASEGNVR